MPDQNKKYHIYGLGNALVDIEIEVSETELKNLGIEKGVMTLIDENQQKATLEALQGVKHSRACGGSAANSIIGAQELGAQCFYSCKVANDETGDFYFADLKKWGVDTNLSYQQREDGHTGKCLVMITADADRTMNTFLGVTGDISYAEVNEQALANSEYLYIEGYLVSSEPALEAAIKAKAFAENNGVKTAFSLSDPNMVRFFKPQIEQVIGNGVDLLFCNHDEAMMFTECTTIEQAVEALKQVANQVVVTLGAEGALVHDGIQIERIGAHQVEAVDTNGAGDLFAGSFIFGLVNQFPLPIAASLASYASSLLVTEFGPRLSAAGIDKVRNFANDLKAEHLAG